MNEPVFLPLENLLKQDNTIPLQFAFSADVAAHVPQLRETTLWASRLQSGPYGERFSTCIPSSGCGTVSRPSARNRACARVAQG